MKSDRRNALAFLAATAPALAACAAGASGGTGTSGGALTVPVTLAGAQAQAPAVEAAIQGWVTANEASLSATEQNDLTTALAALNASVVAFVAIPENATWEQDAQAVVQGIAAVAAVIPLSPAIMLGIEASSMLLTALLAGLASLTVTTAPAAAASAKATAPILVRGVAPPIPIAG